MFIPPETLKDERMQQVKANCKSITRLLKQQRKIGPVPVLLALATVIFVTDVW